MSAKPWEVWKDVLYPGRVVVSGEGGRPVSYTFTAADLHAVCENGNRKVAECWNVPGCWEHQDVQPVRLSQAEKALRMARGVFCRTKAYRVKDGHLQTLLTGDDPKDLDQFRKVGFVSPEIVWDWRDSDGKVWAGPTITHVAATPRPVQRHQHPVGAIALSHAANQGVFATLPAFLAALPGVARVASTISSIRLSLDHYAEAPTVADETETPKKGDDEGNGGAEGELKELIDALRTKHGLDISDKVTTLRELIIAMDSCGDAETEEEPEPENTDLEQPPEGAAAPTNPAIQMSLEAQTKRAEAVARRTLEREIDELDAHRQAQPAVTADLRKRLKSVKLSFTDAGEVEPNEVTIRLGALKQNPRGSAYSLKNKPGKVQLSQTREVPRSPYEAVDPESPEQVAKTVEDWNATGKK